MNDIPEGYELVDDSIPDGYELVDQPTATPKETPTQIYNKIKQQRQDFGSVGNTVLEAASGINRGAANIVDFFTTKPANAISNLMGLESRSPMMKDVFGAQTTGDFMDEGLAKNVIRGASEILTEAALGGGLLRQATKVLPAIAPAAESVKAGVLRQLGSSTAAADLGYGGISGGSAVAGGELGESFGGETGKQIGQALGALFGPMTASFMKDPITLAVQATGRGIKNAATNSPSSIKADEAAEGMLADAMVRSNMTPDQAIAKLKSLGPDAMSADISDNFTRLLKTIKTQVPRVQGVMNQRLDARQAESSKRMLKSLDEASGLNEGTLSGELQALDDVMKPQIRQMYQDSSDQYLHKGFSAKLKRFFASDTSIGKANRMAQAELKDRALIGDRMTKLDEIDATKRVMDDQIQKIITSQGVTNKVRRLVMMKNEMVKEADETIPVYGEARNMYAGKAATEEAGKMGTNIFKIKADDLPNITQTYGESERQMFKLGAKKAIVDKVNDIRTNANVVDRLFGKNGDMEKMRYLFDDQAKFDQFSSTLEKEARYALTRRTLQGGSDTKANFEDAKNVAESFRDFTRATSNPSDAMVFVNNVLNKFNGKETGEAFKKSLEEAGFILSQTNIDLAKLQMMMKRGNAKEIANRLNQVINRYNNPAYKTSASISAVSGDEE